MTNYIMTNYIGELPPYIVAYKRMIIHIHTKKYFFMYKQYIFKLIFVRVLHNKHYVKLEQCHISVNSNSVG